MHISNAGVVGLIPGPETKIPHTALTCLKKKESCYKDLMLFSLFFFSETSTFFCFLAGWTVSNSTYLVLFMHTHDYVGSSSGILTCIKYFDV